MDVVSTILDFIQRRDLLSGSVGFVPTMGALHEGHLSLIRKSKKENEVTVCSIFVNPIQFNNVDDFNKYPSTLSRDLELLQQEGCDMVFVPDASEMYPSKPVVKFDFGKLETVMEGAFRPGHFSGVAIVLSKLFNVVRPSIAYFGQKDLQQTLVVKQLVTDLGFCLTLDIVKTAREKDGLAMSSRNIRLKPALREKAPDIYKELLLAKEKVLSGQTFEEVLLMVKHRFEMMKEVKLEYFEFADAKTLQPITNNFKGEVAICVAVYFGEVRLIDNILFEKSR